MNIADAFDRLFTLPEDQLNDPANPPEAFHPVKDFYEFTCHVCGELERTHFVKGVVEDMIRYTVCFDCLFWFNHARAYTNRATVIDGSIYTPGDRVSGPFRGMGGRRFDIEYLGNSAYAGKRVTTYDLWGGGKMPDHVRKHMPDTAQFLNGAKSFSTPDGGGSFRESRTTEPPYPLPKDALKNT